MRLKDKKEDAITDLPERCTATLPICGRQQRRGFYLANELDNVSKGPEDDAPG